MPIIAKHRLSSLVSPSLLSSEVSQLEMEKTLVLLGENKKKYNNEVLSV